MYHIIASIPVATVYQSRPKVRGGAIVIDLTSDDQRGITGGANINMVDLKLPGHNTTIQSHHYDEPGSGKPVEGSPW